MIAGLPGTGIGGLYYLLLALWMPFREFLSGRRGSSNPDRRRLVRRQVALTVCVVAGLWVTGWVMGWLLLVLLPVVLGPAPSGSGSLVVNVLTLPPILLTLGVLVAVYVGVRVLRLVV